MASIADSTYPQIVWRERTKKLWNPIHKKALKNRPEERVRLRVMEALIRAGWSKHRISTEESVGELGDTSMRTDIIGYNQAFEPKLLVECKAEHISISTKTAEQIARYNQKVGAPYVLMTNGVSDFWYGIEIGENKTIETLQERPDIVKGAADQNKYEFEDWKKRGFVGDKANPDLRTWQKEMLPALWFDQESSVRYLQFGEGPSDVDLNHYYRIVRVSDQRRLAITTLNTAFGGNRMVVILNKDNENRAVMEINLDLLFDEKEGNSSVYSRDGIRTFDLSNFIQLEQITAVNALAEQVDKLFKEYVE